MGDPAKILTIVGTYRKGGIIDTAGEEILASAQDAGAEIEKVYLIDKHIEFCTNCRIRTHVEGYQAGVCALKDGLWR